MDMEDLYETAAINDKKVYKYISNKNTDAVFQLGSNMMKGLIDDIKPTEFNDIVAINALGRPGPLTAGFNTMYANGKNGGEIEYPIRDCEDILNETYGVIAYQEQLMAVSKKVSGFDDTQADSITRKVTAKKKKKLFPMMIRSHIFGKKNCEGPAGWENDDNAPWYDPEGHYGGEIEGAVANGYSVEEMKEYFESIMGFASYAFNKSHAACYSYMSYLCAWLKLNYPTQFMAAVLTMADEKKLPGLVDICDKMNLKISVPDINLSETDFTPNGHTILYGLSAVKGVGDKAIPDILANRPYDDVTDAVSKIPKKAFNKRIGKALIEAGAFDAINNNRMEVMNQYFDARKDKDERFHPEFYDKRACMEFEQESLGAYVTYKPWWDTVAANSKVEVTGQIISVREQVDKRGGLMAFVSIRANDCVFDGLIFASKYGKINDLFNNNYYLTVSGKKNDKGTFIINNAKVAEESEKQTA
jgi:DNA polymerase-3 subunit alpha